MAESGTTEGGTGGHDQSESAAQAAPLTRATARTTPDKDQPDADTYQTAADTDQTAADMDQTAADKDQTASDADQTASDEDQTASAADQRLSDRDQAAADLEEEGGETDGAAEQKREATRVERERVSTNRQITRAERQWTTTDRDETAGARDAVAALRDERALERDELAASVEESIGPIETIAERFRQLREQAAADRAAAARDRERAATERAEAARERARLEAELQAAHLDDLTGAYRREMGRLTVAHELDRARRGDGRFVLAFVDVDDLRIINNRDGHAAGDEALKAVVTTMRDSLRSYDLIFRYGGDEFVAGMSGADLSDAKQRFDTIRETLAREAGISISVGLAALSGGETADELTAQADQALSKIKGDRRHQRNTSP